MNTTIQLQAQYDALKKEQPRLRIRSAAAQLGVSELELLELNMGKSVTRLEGGWKLLLQELEPLGKVMALTRNEYCVHERKGIYKNVSFMENHNMGVAVNEDIDIRFLMWDWAYAYAVTMERGNRTLYSFQFFDSYGEAIHKIYLTPQSDVAVYEQLVRKFRSDNQQTPTFIANRIRPTKERTPDKDIDAAGFQEDWKNLKDTHDFFPLMRKYKLQRLQALNMAPEGYAYQLDNQAIVQMFEKAAAQELPIMVFVGNKGCIQIHTGTVKKLVPMKGWFNVMDPDFNLHLQTGPVNQVWVTKKPTVDGHVTGIEVYDADGEMIVQCFGKRKPGKPELDSWRSLVDSLS